MQSKEYLKIKARKLAKQTWAGPGKFGVFIVICIIVIATFESLGLSNREKNLELRTVPLVAVNLNLKSIEEGVDGNITKDQYKPLKFRSLKDFENLNQMRENIILLGAMDQYVYENEVPEETSYTKILQSLITRELRDPSYQSEIIIEENEEMSFFDI